ncbi:alpha/beta fold hydrolase [Arthrobacter sp. HY1533]|uniref:alpha/beta fold hydrolase n=1 Tax=Arthrobacter sp. HY1533 TaxID=2970919 RepID=UPI0022B9E847|nr:alpha/beta hydrolase [Arthrobacter sp. HY1533]
MESAVRRLELGTGITVPCLEVGDPGAPPLLLLHAWGESGRSFDRLVPLLRGFRILAPDLRGQGGADKPDGGYSLAGQAEDAAAILSALGVPRAFVLGSSSGGYVAQQLAVMHPGMVAGLVLVGAPQTLNGRPGMAAEVEALADPISEDWVRASLAWFPLLHHIPQWFLEDRVRDGTAMPAHAWKNIMAGLCAAIPPTEAGSIGAPTLVLWGGADNVLPRSQQDALLEKLDGAVLKVYDGVGHLVLWECPDRVAADTVAFLRALA